MVLELSRAEVTEALKLEVVERHNVMFSQGGNKVRFLMM